MIKIEFLDKWLCYRKGEVALVETKLGRLLVRDGLARPRNDQSARALGIEVVQREKMYPVQFTDRYGIYNPGEIAGFPLDKFREILKTGTAIPVDDEGKAESARLIEEQSSAIPDPDTPQAKARLKAVREIVEILDPEEAELWQEDGRPKIEALREATGIEDLTETERDTVWAEFEA